MPRTTNANRPILAFAMIERDELLAWLRLLQTPELGRGSVRRLLAVFGSPQGVIAAGSEALRNAVGAKVAEALGAVPDGLDALVDRTLGWLEEVPQRAIVTLGDALYPASLLETADPPLLLHLQGRVELLTADSLAVVGSRNPTRQGTDNARDFARHLSQAGLTIVSGLALGIDGAAHEGGLLGPGSTIAVVGTGLDRVYPAAHDWLARAVVERGFLVSEFPPGTVARKHHFPRRNRIISGLSLAVVVIEAPEASGSLITARCALEQGREVLVVPGAPGGRYRGGHLLVNDGARLVEHADDIRAAVNLMAPGREPAAGPPPADEPVLRALVPGEWAELDDIVARAHLAPPAVLARLATLELEGWVERGPGGRFVRVARKW